MSKVRFLNSETVTEGSLHFVQSCQSVHQFAPANPEEQQSLRELELRNFGDVLYTEMHTIHGEAPTLNHTYFPNNSLQGNGIDTGFMSHLAPYPTPLITNHIQFQVENVLGRSHKAGYIIDTEHPGSGIISVIYAITDETAKRRVLAGEYLTTSVGARTDAFYCAVCNANWLVEEEYMDCIHERGKVYDGVVMSLKIGQYWNMENSFVVAPADRRAGVVRPSVLVGLGNESYRLGDTLTNMLQRKVVAVDGFLKNTVLTQEEDEDDMMGDGPSCRKDDMPLAPKEMAWDGPGAKSRMLSHCQRDDDSYMEDAGDGFCTVQEDGSKAEHYKLPFADIVDGEMKCVYKGCVAAKQRLPQTDGVDEDEAAEIADFLDKQIARFPQDKEAAPMADDATTTENVVEEEGTPAPVESPVVGEATDKILETVMKFIETLGSVVGKLDQVATALSTKADISEDTEEKPEIEESDDSANVEEAVVEGISLENFEAKISAMVATAVAEALATKTTEVETVVQESGSEDAEATLDTIEEANSISGREAHPSEVVTEAEPGTEDKPEVRIPWLPKKLGGRR